MIEAVTRLRPKMLKETPNAGMDDPEGAVPVAVSADGIWQKRGYTSGADLEKIVRGAKEGMGAVPRTILESHANLFG